MNPEDSNCCMHSRRGNHTSFLTMWRVYVNTFHHIYHAGATLHNIVLYRDLIVVTFGIALVTFVFALAT